MKRKINQKSNPINTFICPNCGNIIYINNQTFLDVTNWPRCRDKLMDLSLFNKRCTHCGEEVYIEYPIEYMDEKRGFVVLMAPGFDEDFLSVVNSAKPEAFTLGNYHTYRVVPSVEELVEKILIFESNRDDVVIEVYKVFLRERLKEEWPDMNPELILYYNKDGDEYFVIWDNVMTPGSEKLTVAFDEEHYNEIIKDFGNSLKLTDNKKYWVIDEKFILKRVLK